MRFIKKKAVCQIVSYSPAHIARLEKEGKFPKRVQLGQARVAWVEQEVLDWMKAKADAR